MSYKSIILTGLAMLSPFLSDFTFSGVPLHERSPYELSKEKFNSTMRYFEAEYGLEQANQLEALKMELISKGHDEELLFEFLSEARLNDRVVELFRENILRSTDSGDISYEDFAARINLEELKEQSHRFVEDHREELLQAEEIYGVDFRYIVGIKGIETRYGDSRSTGNFNLLNSLVTQYILADRKRFSVSQLDAVLQLNKKYNAEVQHTNGSYAGAIGVAQWIPFSLLHYGKMEDINDITSTRKMIPSTANYLSENGWNSSLNGSPVVPGSRNWNVILRYNRSNTYAKVVVEIAEQIER